MERRERTYRRDRPTLDLRDQVVIVVDDGMATGATIKPAVLAVKGLRASEVAVAVPVASPEACSDLQGAADRVVCLEIPVAFSSVGQWYDDFREITDEEVRKYLKRNPLA